MYNEPVLSLCYVSVFSMILSCVYYVLLNKPNCTFPVFLCSVCYHISLCCFAEDGKIDTLVTTGLKQTGIKEQLEAFFNS